jgi:hypothetical protein
METPGDAQDDRHVTRGEGLLLALFLLFALPAQAQERFLIERIDVRHLVHASADVVRAESRLREGQQYDEDELRDANNRVKRLPFILDAAFKLERGSVRDAYVLAITVNETKPFFYLWDTVFFKRRPFIELDTESAILAGGRWFAARHDVLHAAAVLHHAERPFESDYASAQAGYTRYGLLGDRAFATLTADRMLTSSNGAKLLPGAVIGISLGPKRTLTISYTAYDLTDFQRRDGRIFEARFAHNTTNHPFFPSEGTLLSIGPVVARTDSATSTAVTHTLDAGVDAHAAEYWPLSARTTVSAVADGGFIRVISNGGSDDKRFAGYGSATLRLSRALHELDDADVQTRAELTLRAVTHQRDATPFRRDSSLQLSAAWVHRNAWGVIRLGLGYAW